METELEVLQEFLKMPISSPEKVFDKFKEIDGAIYKHGENKERFVYVKGTRKDGCVLVAHADTVKDIFYVNTLCESTVVYRDGVFSNSENDILGADDRAGCAMLWLLKNSGHSLLILDGEEHGKVGARFLKEKFPDFYEELNNHTFMIQLDRRGNHDYKFYKIPVTEEFEEFVKNNTGYQNAGTDSLSTDICVLCEKICGVNLSIGYYNEHTDSETLSYSDWLHTLNIVRDMLKRPLCRYTVKTDKETE